MTQHILITGATSGIGHQLVLDYLKSGKTVHAVGRRKQVLEELSALGAHIHHAELTDRQQVFDMVNSIDELDMVICCAGVCHYIDINEELDVKDADIEITAIAQNNNDKSSTYAGDYGVIRKKPVLAEESSCIEVDKAQNRSKNNLNFDSAKIMEVMNINYGTLVNTIEAVLPLLKQSQGRLVAIGSASAYVPFARAEAYGSSKSAVHYLMQTLQISLKPHGIKVNLVIPGFVDTPMTAKNNFPMPFLQTTKQASYAIRTGIAQDKAVIEFPKRLTTPLMTFGVLPTVIWHKVSDRLYNR